MLDKILNPITTASSVGVALRYISTIVGSVLTILGVLGLLSQEQVDTITAQMPQIVSAIGALVAVCVPIYAIFTKSSSDKAAEVAKVVDQTIPEKEPVLVKSASVAASPEVVVPAKK